MEQLTGSVLGIGYNKVVYCHLVYLAYMQSTTCEMLGWMNHKLKLRLSREISNFRYADGEGIGTPLRYSCLENPMDGGAW